MGISFDPAPWTPGGRPYSSERMAKWEINYRFGPIQKLWWKLVRGVEIEVPWPTGDIVVNDRDPRWCDIGGAVWVNLGYSADPNDHYRYWLEEHVGQQGWDWDWRIGQVATVTGARDTLVIKFRKGRERYATMAALQWK